MMFDIFGVPQAVQVIILVVGIIHVIRTQRSWWWILLMVWLPVIGFAIYFFMEWLPEIRRPFDQVRKFEQPWAGRR